MINRSIHHRTFTLNIGRRLDHFVDSNHIARSEKNAQNRSLQGSTSYIATRHKKKNPETQEPQVAIENWKYMHYRPNSGWVNDGARIDHVEKVLRRLEGEVVVEYQIQHEVEVKVDDNEAKAAIPLVIKKGNMNSQTQNTLYM